MTIMLSLLALICAQTIKDRRSADPVRKKFPVIFACALQLKKAAPFIRRYLLNDTSADPLDREHVIYIQEAALGGSNTHAFGIPIKDISNAPIRINAALLPYPASTMHCQPLLIGKSAQLPYIANRRIYISAMGVGVLSHGAALALSHGARKAQILLNIGEAGLLPGHLDSNSDLVFQVGVAGFLCKDVNGNYSESLFKWLGGLPQIKMFEVKMSQGAKPGVEGGGISASSMIPENAIARGVMPFSEITTSHMHANIHNEQDLLKLVAMIKKSSGKPVGIKVCLSTEAQITPLLERMAELRRERKHELPDFITLDGAEGGTILGAYHMLRFSGMPITESLPLLHNLLSRYQLRDDILIFASGQLSTPERAAWAFASGADMIGVARGFMLAMGCIQALKCETNRCPSGIATRGLRQSSAVVPELKSENVARYASSLERDLLGIAKACGVSCYSKLTVQHVRLTTGFASEKVAQAQKHHSL